jgi:photosystem II stability/assembly factor-like uncharacterized protein
MLKKYGFILSCALLSAFSLPLAAQEVKEEEVLKVPFKTTSEVGAFKELNHYPESIRRSKPFARYMHRFQRVADENGTYDATARYEAFTESQGHLLRESYKQSKGENSIFADAWVNIGPSNFGGCTKTLAIHPTTPSTIYAGAAGGGVWKTTNSGASWTPLTDLVIPDLATVSIAIDPNNTNTIYAGSGDGSFSANALAGTGLYKSTNAGGSWTKIGATQLSRTVNKVLVHPTNSSVVFACNFDGTGSNGKGLYRSTNGGTSFTRVFPATKNADGVIWDVVQGATISGKTIFYLVEGNVGSGTSSECGIYKSIDDGVTWGKLSTSTLPEGALIGKAALACPRANQSKLYCFMATPSGNLRGLYRSIDGGTSFSSVTVPNTIFSPNGGTGQGWYDLCIGISPNSSGTGTNDTVLIGGVEAYRTYNGGSSWTSYSDYGGNSAVHVDHHAIAFNPISSKQIFIGNDGGIYKSTNAGSTWNYSSNNYHTMRFYHIGLDKTDYKATMGGTQDQGSWRTYLGNAPSFRLGGDGFHTIIDPNTPSTYYCEGPYGELYKITNNSTVTPITGGSFEPESAWDTPFIMAPKSNTTLYTGRTKVWKSTDQGNSWDDISPVLSSSHIQALAVSPSNTNVIFAGLTGGRIKKTTNGGADWTDENTLASPTVESIVCHPRDASWALISLASTSTNAPRVMLTTNGGEDWTNKSGTAAATRLPGVPVSQVALDSTDPANIWYAATDNGMYYTRDAGVTWSIAGSGIGLSPCWDVQVHPNKITIRVGTHGRSIWEANANILPVELTSLTAQRTLAGTSLSWATESETTNSGFKVQRSFNYAEFEDIAFVPGAGNSNIHRDYSYLDTKIDAGYYIYRLKQIDLDGAEHLSNIVEVRYGSDGTTRLDQNFPNPYILNATGASMTKIRFAIPTNDKATLAIYSITGDLIRTLLRSEELPAGEQIVNWDGKDENGGLVADGVYQYTLVLESGTKLWNKMVVIKQ